MDFGKGYLTTLKFYFLHYRSFLEFIEGYIEKTIKSFDDENPVDEELILTNPDYYHFYVDDVAEKWWQYSRDFPSEFRTTFLSQVYSGVDSHLHKICERYHKIHLPHKTVKQFSGSEWAQKAKYLKKYAAVDFKTLQDEWDFLENIRQIRNHIIHHHSCITYHDKDWHTVKQFIDKNSNLIRFKDNIDEKDEDGKLEYKKYPDHPFEFQIHSPRLNELLMDKSEAFFNKLLPQISFKTPS